MIIDELLDAAVRGAGARSAHDLEIKTGISSCRFAAYRRGHGFPTDETMLKLCGLAEVDPVPWLIWLNSKRTEGEVSRVYERHLAQVTRKKPAKGVEVIAA